MNHMWMSPLHIQTNQRDDNTSDHPTAIRIITLYHLQRLTCLSSCMSSCRIKAMTSQITCASVAFGIPYLIPYSFGRPSRTILQRWSEEVAEYNSNVSSFWMRDEVKKLPEKLSATIIIQYNPLSCPPIILLSSVRILVVSSASFVNGLTMHLLGCYLSWHSLILYA